MDFRTHLGLLVFLALLPVQPLIAQNGAGLSADTIKRIEAVISAEMKQYNIPGLSVAVVTDHQLRWSGGYGLADLENLVPAKPLTNYGLGSLSKPLTATAVLQLAEQGKLDLDATLQTYARSIRCSHGRSPCASCLGIWDGAPALAGNRANAGPTRHSPI